MITQCEQVGVEMTDASAMGVEDPLTGLEDDSQEPVQRLTDHMIEMMERMRRRKEKFRLATTELLMTLIASYYSLKEFFDEEVRIQRMNLVSHIYGIITLLS